MMDEQRRTYTFEVVLGTGLFGSPSVERVEAYDYFWDEHGLIFVDAISLAGGPAPRRFSPNMASSVRRLSEEEAANGRT